MTDAEREQREREIDWLKIAIQQAIQQAMVSTDDAGRTRTGALCAALEEDAEARIGEDYITADHRARYGQHIQQILSLMARHEHEQITETPSGPDHAQIADRVKALHDAFTAITTWRNQAT